MRDGAEEGMALDRPQVRSVQGATIDYQNHTFGRISLHRLYRHCGEPAQNMVLEVEGMPSDQGGKATKLWVNGAPGGSGKKGIKISGELSAATRVAYCCV